MKFSTALKLAVLGVVFAALPVVLTSNAKVAAHSGEKIAQSDAQSNKENKDEGSDSTYNYVAQPGDSYSLIARKAVQTYGIIHKVNLSQAQIIYAETHLTQTSGSQELSVGQKVDVKESTVKTWVESAQKLSKADQANWDYYVQFANFNTNTVGQAS